MLSNRIYKFSAAAMSLVMVASLAACGTSKKEEIEPTPTPIPEDYILPEDCLLTDESMQKSIESYMDYVNDVIDENGLSLELEVKDDGTAVINAVPDKNTTAEGVDDIVSFESVEYMFAYLYNHEQVDIEGNVLVRSVPDVLDEIEKVKTEAESEAESMMSAQGAGEDTSE